MTGHLGSAVRMVPVVPTAAQQETTAPRYVAQETRARRWVFDTGAHRPRSWSVDTSLMTSGEARALSEVAAWGPGPWWWVSCAAHDSNVLTPRMSLLDGHTGGGVDAVGSWSPVSHVGPGRVVLAERVPVIPGQPFTVAVEASGAAVLRVVIRNAGGGVSSTQTVEATGTLMQRLIYTAPAAPATARTVDIEVEGHIRVTRPQLSWTGHEVPWTAGRGAAQVVMQSMGVDLVALTGRSAYWDGSVTLLEVG